jgi:hypothetical protein
MMHDLGIEPGFGEAVAIPQILRFIGHFSLDATGFNTLR